MEVKVRPARPNEAGIIVRFNRALAEETEGLRLDARAVLDGVRAVLDDTGKGFYLLAEVDDEVVGQVLVTPEWSDWRGGYFWWVQSVYVRPDRRRRGVLRALLEGVVEAATERGDVVGLRLYVHQRNATARLAYRRLGWREADYLLYERPVPPPTSGADLEGRRDG